MWRPGFPARAVAERICNWAWKGKGVRVYRWPCGTLAVAKVGTPADDKLLSQCIAMLVATYARHGLDRVGKLGDGPMLDEVIEELCAGQAAVA